MLTTRVKANAVTHLTDARYFAAWEVAWLGFQLSAGENGAVAPAQVAAIREWVDGPLIVGEWETADAYAVQQLAAQLSLDLVQLGDGTPLHTLRSLSEGHRLIQEIVVEGYHSFDFISERLEQVAPLTEFVLLNFTRGGITWPDVQAGYPIAVAQLAQWCQAYPLVLEIDAPDAAQLVQQLQPHGLSIRGGAEEKVGYKAYDELDDFFVALEVEN